ncbi:MAG: ATP-binding protein [Ruminococcaceae bacterium]|nr:ATP-binding protein [Oscillospiraceae bacterium]
MYLLSGSQAYHLMQHVSESMAGRIAIVNLAGLNSREVQGLPSPGLFIPSREHLQQRGRNSVSNDAVWSFIFQGQYPRLHTDNANRDAWYAAYTATYIERDVRQLLNIIDTESFMKFLSSIAARSGELLNYASVSKDIGVSANTVKNWLNILQASGVVYLLPAWSGNHLKRALKTPKVYFLDTGLLAWLTRWPSADTIKMGAKAGQFFETYVISEIVKSAFNVGITRPELYFYRDKDQREIDLIIQDGRTLYPVEIKMSATPSLSMAKHFELMPQIAAADHLDIGTSTILCQCPQLIHLDRDTLAVPVQYL